MSAIGKSTVVRKYCDSLPDTSYENVIKNLPSPKQVALIVIFPSSFHACTLVLHTSHCILDSLCSSVSLARFDLLRPSYSHVGYYLCSWTLPRSRHYCPHSQHWIWLVTLFLRLLDCVHAWLGFIWQASHLHVRKQQILWSASFCALHGLGCFLGGFPVLHGFLPIPGCLP